MAPPNVVEKSRRRNLACNVRTEGDGRTDGVCRRKILVVAPPSDVEKTRQINLACNIRVDGDGRTDGVRRVAEKISGK